MRHVVLRNFASNELLNIATASTTLISKSVMKITDSLKPATSDHRKMALSTSSRASGVGGGGGESPSQSRGDHIDITYQQTRSPSTMTAHITDISQLSPTIKGFSFKIDSELKHTFKAGQWVDFFIPGMDKIGGFSMSSHPSLLTEKQMLDLAVKFSTWGPAYWLHTKAEIGSSVALRVGGDFHYPNLATEAAGNHNLLLVAGGVGINPMASIFRHAAASQATSSALSKVKLIYSARTADELIFKDSFDAISRENPSRFSAEYFVTREDCNNSGLNHGRFTSKNLKDSLTGLGDQNGETFCYLCGPTAFIQDTNRILQSLGVKKSNIFFELWW